MNTALQLEKDETSAVEAFKALPLKAGDITSEMLDELEAWIFHNIHGGQVGFYEINIPTTHSFTRHTYVREAVMPKGSLIIGHYHKETHVCVVLKGRMSILNPDRSVTEIVAPAVFIGAPGRKVGLMHEDVLMQNIHSMEGWPENVIGVFCRVFLNNNYTSEDVDLLEEYLYRRTDAYKKHQELNAAMAQSHRILTG